MNIGSIVISRFYIHIKKTIISRKRVKISFYLFIADFFATQIIGGAKELVVLL